MNTFDDVAPEMIVAVTTITVRMMEKFIASRCSTYEMHPLHVNWTQIDIDKLMWHIALQIA